jgi:hypothetical protein
MLRRLLARVRRLRKDDPEGQVAEVEVIPDHESPVRRMVAGAHGQHYEAIESLEQAKATADAAVVMQGDDGGSIYLTCPARLVRCDEPTLLQLLHDLDKHDWNDPEGVGLYYEVAPVGSGVAGGSGGGVVTNSIWLHPELEQKGLREQVEAVIAGDRTRIN